MVDLRTSAQTGVSVTFIAGLITQAGQFILGLILARILNPSDYGLTGMLAIFIAISDTFVDSGLGTAIMWKKTPKHDDYSTVFWYNVLISGAFYLIIALTAPIIADFYGDERLISLARVLSLVIIINAAGSIQGKYLNKNLRYTDLSKVGIISFIGSSIFAVLLAWLGFGVWALVGRSIVLAIMLNGGWWIKSSWKPDLKFSMKSFKELFGYGSKLLGTSLFDTVFNNLYSIIIGKLFSADKLGYYTRAKQFQDLPDRSFRSILMSIFFPILSQLQDDDERLLRTYKKLLGIIAFILYPVFAILACMAYPLIEIILTPKWLPSVPLLQILCLIPITYPFQSINENVLYIKGKSEYVLYSTIIRRIILLSAVIALFRFGVKGLIWGLVAEGFLSVVALAFYSKKVFSYGLTDQIKDILVIMIISSISFLVMIAIKAGVSDLWGQLILIPFSGALVYLSLSYLFKRPELKEVKDLWKFAYSKILSINRLYDN